MKRAKRYSGGKCHQKWWMFHCYLMFDWECCNKVYCICMHKYIPYLIMLLMEEILHQLGCIKTVDDGINYLSTGAGFQPSTVWPPFAQKVKNLHLVKECLINTSTHLPNRFNQIIMGCSPFQKRYRSHHSTNPKKSFLDDPGSSKCFHWKCYSPEN